MPDLVDLHAHSTASDGNLSPAAVVARAAKRGVAVLALTDHDTVDGLPEAMAAGESTGVRVIPGIEISVAVPHGMLHLLGYLPDAAPPVMVARLAGLQADRRRRVDAILARLDELGVPVTMEQIARHTTGSVGRPHIAQAMVDAGHVPSRHVAFLRYLGDDRPGYVPHRGIAPHDAVRLVRDAGGVPVLAHPFTLRLGNRKLEAFVASLKHAGLVGIEVHRPDHSPEQRDAFARIARRLSLVPSGGSDFHAPGHGFDLGETGTPPLPSATADVLFATLGQRVPSPG